MCFHRPFHIGIEVDRIDDLDIRALSYSSQCPADPFEATPETFPAMAGDKNHPPGRVKRQTPGQIVRDNRIVFNSGDNLLEGVDNRIARYMNLLVGDIFGQEIATRLSTAA